MFDPSNPNIENRDILIIGFPWNEPIGSNAKDLSFQFFKKNRVLYVNFPMSRGDFNSINPSPELKERIESHTGKRPEITKISDNLYQMEADVVTIPHNGIKIPFLFDIVNRINNKNYSKRIQKALNELGFKNIILFSDQSIYHSFYLKEFLKPDWFIYYSRDFLQGVDYWKPNGTRLEPKIIRKADICVGNSHYLMDFTAQYNAHSYYIGQGCDVSLFNPDKTYEIPEGMKNIPKPIIGYVGALVKRRLDIDLLIYIAKNKPDWSLVLVGPEDEDFKKSELHQIPNVYFLGNQLLETLPGYIENFDVCINPQILNPITIGNYPRKIDEYLAMGKPVVALKTQAMREFENYTYLATEHSEFITEATKALAENSPEKARDRIHFASTHTWENSFALISNAFFTEENQRKSNNTKA